MDPRSDQRYLLLKKLVTENSHNLCEPSAADTTNVMMDSWFDLGRKETGESKLDSTKIHAELVQGKSIRCMKVKLLLTNSQKCKLNRWMDAYIKMYNETIKYIKTYGLNSSWKKIRDILKAEKRRIANSHSVKSERGKEKFKSVHIGSLDGSIKLACANCQSAISNLRAGNIKHFRMRYWKRNRDSKIFTVPVDAIGTRSIYPSVFSEMKCEYNGKPFDLRTVCHESTVICREDLYTLLVPTTVAKDAEWKAKRFISLDPGLRTFMTGVSENEEIKIGTDARDKIVPYINRLHKLSTIFPTENRKKKTLRKMYNRKLLNIVDDLHWKTINYLTKVYDTILVGDLSVKGIVSNDTSILGYINKDLAHRLAFSTFRTRLQSKCETRGCKYAIVDEHYTSKTCSYCGNYKADLGGNEIYHCHNCHRTIDRDINGARNILFRTL